jgi:hypothetical protein
MQDAFVCGKIKSDYRLRIQSPSPSIIRRFIQLVYSKENQPQIVAQRGYQNEKEQKNHTIRTPSLCKTIPPQADIQISLISILCCHDEHYSQAIEFCLEE